MNDPTLVKLRANTLEWRKVKVIKNVDSTSNITKWFKDEENKLKPFDATSKDQLPEEWIPNAPMLPMGIAS